MEPDELRALEHQVRYAFDALGRALAVLDEAAAIRRATDDARRHLRADRVRRAVGANPAELLPGVEPPPSPLVLRKSGATLESRAQRRQERLERAIGERGA